jgi:hypothetical protein
VTLCFSTWTAAVDEPALASSPADGAVVASNKSCATRRIIARASRGLKAALPTGK